MENYSFRSGLPDFGQIFLLFQERFNSGYLATLQWIPATERLWNI